MPRECGEVCKAVAVEGVRHHRPQRTVDRSTANRHRHAGIFRLLVERAVLIEKGLRVGQVACRKPYHARLQFPQGQAERRQRRMRAEVYGLPTCVE